MPESLVYEGAMQVVPLLIVALFIDNRTGVPEPRTLLGRRLMRGQDRVIAVLCFAAFFISMFVLAGIIPVTSWTNGIVIAALSGSIGLLFGTIWRRFAAEPHEADTPRPPLPTPTEDDER